MEALTRFAIDRSRTTWLAMIAIILMGFASYGALAKRENPVVTIRHVSVTAALPGVSADRVEQLLAIPLERAVRDVTAVEEIASRITTGQVALTVKVRDSVSATDLDAAFQDIRTAAEGAAPQLPDGTQGPFVNTSVGAVAIATIAVTGDGFSLPELVDAAEDLRAGLYEVEGVTRVDLYGVQDERIWLEVDTRKLAAVGVQIPQVISDLAAQNVILPAGRLDVGGTTITLQADGDLTTAQDVESVLTAVPGLQGFLRLGDLLTVRRGTVDPPERPVFFDGAPAILVAVEMADDADIQKVGTRIAATVPRIEAGQPLGIVFSTSTDQEKNVTVAINAALSNVAQTFVLVLITMVAFMGLRAGVAVAAIVPFAVCLALLSFGLLGVDVEQISIAAIIISLGLLVDNGLVVVEDIDSRIRAGEAPNAAAIAAGGQFLVPLAVGSITTIAAFIPMFLLDGTTGDFAFSLGAVVTVVLTASWLVAHTVLPLVTVTVLRGRKPGSETGPGLLARATSALVRRLMPFRIVVIAVCYGLVLSTLGVFGTLKSEMFPLSERTEFLIYLDLPRGSSITATEREALAVARWLGDKDQNPEVANTTVFVGDGGPRFYLALNPADADAESAFILVNTTSPEGAVVAAERARRYLFEQVPAARSRITRLSMGSNESGITEIKIEGPDALTLLGAAARIEAAAADLPGIVLNRNDWGNPVLNISVLVAQNAARELGLSSEDISNGMEAFFSGVAVSSLREGDTQIPIVLRAEKDARDELEDLGRVVFATERGLVTLDQVSRLRPNFELSQIRRVNQARRITVSIKSETLSAAEVLDQLNPTLAALDLPEDYSVTIGGETVDSAETNAKLAAGLPWTVALMLAALVLQFNSIRRVALTLATIPLIMIGAPVGLALTNQPLSFFAILGLISLMGIIVNNAIVLIDQIEVERRSAAIHDAVLTALEKRVRPVLMTSATTILGLIPLAFFGGPLFEPMATIMIGGLAVASPLSLLFVPAGYALMFRDQKVAEQG